MMDACNQFQFQFKVTSRVALNGSQLPFPQERDFALLKCFERAGNGVGDKLAAAGCVRIKPDTRQNRPWYEVVPFSEILSREYVVPKHNEAGVRHVSCFVSH